MTISIISAIAENNVIGKDNDLIWHISEDLKRFKRITAGHTVIMGRKTYESLPFKPLPKRTNIVITRDKNLKLEGVLIVSSPEEAIEKCKGEEEVFICGGASIYKHFLSIADKMYLTKLYHSFEGDTYFPEINYDNWNLIEKIDSGDKDKYKFSFLDYVRK